MRVRGSCVLPRVYEYLFSRLILKRLCFGRVLFCGEKLDFRVDGIRRFVGLAR